MPHKPGGAIDVSFSWTGLYVDQSMNVEKFTEEKPNWYALDIFLLAVFRHKQ